MGVGTRRDVFVQLGTSIGNGPAVTPARGPRFAHQAFQVRKRLGDGETALRRAELGAEHDQRDVVGGAGAAGQRSGRFVESLTVVGVQSAASNVFTS